MRYRKPALKVSKAKSMRYYKKYDALIRYRMEVPAMQEKAYRGNEVALSRHMRGHYPRAKLSTPYDPGVIYMPDWEEAVALSYVMNMYHHQGSIKSENFTKTQYWNARNASGLSNEGFQAFKAKFEDRIEKYFRRTK